ncbi:small T [Betapolyomavirus vicugnae]|uniref:Small t antigen n=1 Tax=Alpaca polyomavirus TaxID=1970065 RepID=A0A1V0CLV5_9POLY|nr:small T [Betapolyomavirus vicugnae]ARA71320.1 small T [Betapolyomavirus vicugnae]
MDRTLDREESKELMALLGLSMSCWGNIPMMRRAYKVQCRNLHPDKGGDEEKMKRLTELYKKLEETLGVIHSQNESEEGSWNASEVVLSDPNCPCCQNLAGLNIGDIYGDIFSELIVKDWLSCKLGWNTKCTCFMCKLRRRHRLRVKAYKRPLKWVECYCFECYVEWFGFCRTFEANFWWQKIIFFTPFLEIKL